MNLINNITALYIAAAGKWHALKGDEDAMEVIQVVMIIAIGVIAVVAIWAGINGYIEKIWDMILGKEIPDDIKIDRP